MNNRLVKEYVRAICELNPKAFVMENVAMLRSRVHRFFLEEQDLDNERIMALPLSEDKIEILPECVNFDNSIAFLETARAEMGYAWAESFYKIINILYRYRINPAKFDATLEKYQKKLIAQLGEVLKITAEAEELNVLQENDAKMAKAILQYIEQKDNFDDTVLAISNSIMMQRAIMKIKELTDNDIHIFEYKEDNGSLVAVVKSYPVLDYIRAILENEPYNYTLSENTLNAIHYQRIQSRMFMMYGVEDSDNLHFATAANKIGNGLDEQLEFFVREHPDTKLIVIDTMQKIREVGGEAYSYASNYEIIGRLKQFADKYGICVLIVHHTRKQPAGDSFEMISGTTGLLGCADGALLMQKKKRTGLEATIDVVGRDQQDQILYLSKDPATQLWNLERTETELHREPPDKVLEAVAGLVSTEHREWTGSPSELAEAVNTGMAANALTKYLNVKCGRLMDEYGISYENKAKHSGRRVRLTYTTK